MPLTAEELMLYAALQVHSRTHRLKLVVVKNLHQLLGLFSLCLELNLQHLLYVTICIVQSITPPKILVKRKED